MQPTLKKDPTLGFGCLTAQVEGLEQKHFIGPFQLKNTYDSINLYVIILTTRAGGKVFKTGFQTCKFPCLHTTT